jgi:RimJ/RimL family protein N-acetyltransferase
MNNDSASPALAGPPSAAPVADRARPPWVPIRSLHVRHRSRIGMHLLALNEHDRYLRFGYPATNEQILKYVESLNFERDEVFGIFNRKLELIAMAHLANAQALNAERPAMAEFGVSVLAKVRGRGYGARLFEHAMMHARNRGVDRLFIHALSENTAMLKIARRAGATLERDGSETQAWLKLPAETVATRMGELMEEQAAEIDYRFKVNAHRMQDILDAFSDIRAHTRRKVRNSSE